MERAIWANSVAGIRRSPGLCAMERIPLASARRKAALQSQAHKEQRLWLRLFTNGKATHPERVAKWLVTKGLIAEDEERAMLAHITEHWPS